MGKREKGKRRINASSSSEEEDPEVILHKLTRQRKEGKSKECSSVSKFTSVERPSPRVNGIFIANPHNENEIILFGGERFDGNRCEFFDETFIFNIKDNKWTLLNSPVHPSPRSAHQAVPINKGILLFGGEFGTSKETKYLHFSDTWLFDSLNYSWSQLKMESHPPSRSGHRMIKWNNFILLFGGFHDTGSQVKYLDDLWMLDTEQLKGWRKVDWQNEYESRPVARSGFCFTPHPEGALLYSGYTQVKNKKGHLQGQVLNDLWLLRGDSEGSFRWKKLKLTPSAPLPRSGSVSIPLNEDILINFGGVIDEEVSDEFLMGTCVNDLHIYRNSDNSWTRIDNIKTLDFPFDSFCPRFNPMITQVGNSFFIFGGIYEVGDEQFTLDDIYKFDYSNVTLTRLQSVSQEIEGCWNLKPSFESSDEEQESDSSDSDSSDSTDTDSDSSEGPLTSSDRKPIAASHSSLKEYFDRHSEYWMDAARRENSADGSINEKTLRSTAFMIAKQSWEEQSNLEMNISLN